MSYTLNRSRVGAVGSPYSWSLDKESNRPWTHLALHPVTKPQRGPQGTRELSYTPRAAVTGL